MFDRIKAAIDIAYTAHKGQNRKYGNDIPYIHHPMRVAFKIAQLTRDEVVIAAAILHDVLEDTDVSPDVIARECGNDVLVLVQELTNPSKLPEHCKKPRAERKRIDREHLKEVSYAAKLIKLCDRIDNLYDVGNGPADFRKLYAKESRLLLECLNVHFALETELLAAIEEVERSCDSTTSCISERKD